MFNERGADVHRARTAGAAGAGVGRQPFFVNGFGGGVGIRAVENDHPAGVAVGLKKRPQMFLCAAGFGEYECLASRAGLRHFRKADFEGFQQRVRFGVHADAVRPGDEAFQLGDFRFQPGKVNLGRNGGGLLTVGEFGQIQRFVQVVVLQVPPAR